MQQNRNAEKTAIQQKLQVKNCNAEKTECPSTQPDQPDQSDQMQQNRNAEKTAMQQKMQCRKNCYHPGPLLDHSPPNHNLKL